MKHKTAELEGALLDAAVAICEGAKVELGRITFEGSIVGLAHSYRPSDDWSDGGPLIERERIKLIPPQTARPGMNWEWRAEWHGKIDDPADDDREFFEVGEGETPLIAAMRAYVASKFGDEVELP